MHGWRDVYSTRTEIKSEWLITPPVSWNFMERFFRYVTTKTRYSKMKRLSVPNAHVMIETNEWKWERRSCHPQTLKFVLMAMTIKKFIFEEYIFRMFDSSTKQCRLIFSLLLFPSNDDESGETEVDTPADKRRSKRRTKKKMEATKAKYHTWSSG